MKILIVASYNSNSFSPFVVEQAESLRKEGLEVEYFGIVGHGVFGYVSNISNLKKKIKSFNPDIIHAHYGLSGLVANMQRRIPVVTTFHGSDIHSLGVNLLLSKVCMRLSQHNIFISDKLRKIVSKTVPNSTILPCGVDITLFRPMDKQNARRQLGWNDEQRYIVFAGAFANKVKNATLAQNVVQMLSNVELIELKGYNRDQVVAILNAADVALMTSFSEGSPQFIKEAMACNCPIVATDVGDVLDLIGNLNGCFITDYNVDACHADAVEALRFAQVTGRTDSRTMIECTGLDNASIAKKIVEIYKKIISKKLK